MRAVQVLLVLALFSGIRRATALRGDFTVAVGDSYMTFADFGFKAHGSLSMNLSLLHADEFEDRVIIFACNLRQCQSMPRVATDLCTDPVLLSSASWWRSLNATAPTSSVRVASTSRNTYLFVGVSCGSGATVAVDYHFLNPGGEELPTGQIPYKGLSWGYAVTWTVLLSLWGSCYVCSSQRVPLLFYGFVLLGAMNIIKFVTMATFWTNLSKEGVVDESLYMLDITADSLAAAVFALVIMVLAKGWNITRNRLEPLEVRTIGITSFVVFFASVAWDMVGGFFFMFFTVVVYLCLLRFVYVALSVNIGFLILRLQLALGNNSANALHTARQLVGLRRTRSALSLYMCLDILMSIWVVMSAAIQRDEAVGYALKEGCHLLIVAYLMWQFRLRAASLYWSASDSVPLIPNSSAVPSLPPPVPVVIVRNPGDAAGKTPMVGTPAQFTPTVCRPPDSWVAPTQAYTPAQLPGDGVGGGGGGAGGSGGGGGGSPVGAAAADEPELSPEEEATVGLLDAAETGRRPSL